MITIYHNSRCSKSRDGVCFLENSNIEFEIVNYIKNIPTADELKTILQKLNIPAIELVRKKEAIWIEKYKTKKLSENEIIQAMIEHPNLIERPIIISGNKAIIARPTEKINEIL
ncbi:arsenate reductase (glutaredoxin) [Flavobacterium sp.]|uniref:arsenate reductase (glutaredoxin) n=1 Tax=Flavobacterium sp. TaxID=239 RepID=UPI00286E4AFB|nr:arsenate reductase (glutaredoxin) [Flavobacterium sp.]